MDRQIKRFFLIIFHVKLVGRTLFMWLYYESVSVVVGSAHTSNYKEKLDSVKIKNKTKQNKKLERGKGTKH